MSELAADDLVNARFHGQWYPGQVMHVGANGVRVLWDAEFTCSDLPRSDVVRRVDCQQVFNMAASDSDEEHRTSNASNSVRGLSPHSWLSPHGASVASKNAGKYFPTADEGQAARSPVALPKAADQSLSLTGATSTAQAAGTVQAAGPSARAQAHQSRVCDVKGVSAPARHVYFDV
jgi:hypothetical protein